MFGGDPYGNMGMQPFGNQVQHNPQPAHNVHSNTNANANPDSMSDADLALMQERLLREEQDKQYQDMINKQIQDEQEKHAELEKLRKQMSNEKHQQIAAENKKETILKKLANEPESGQEGCFTAVVRLPSGARLTRNFLKTDTLELLHDYIFVHEDKGFEKNDAEFELMNGYPPKLIENYQQTFEEFVPKKNKELFVLKEKC